MDADWRDDPAWYLVQIDRELWGDRELPAKPTAAAELAQPDAWANLFDGRRIVAVWSRVPRV